MGVLIPEAEWYGADTSWFVPLERGAFRLLGQHLSVEYAWQILRPANPCAFALSCGNWLGVGFGSTRDVVMPLRRYRIDGVDIVGRGDPVPVMIEFRPSRCFGDDRRWDGRDFPSVYAGSMDDSPHRYEDGALCLYYPDDPVGQRWTSDKGLAALIVLIQDHLFLEDTYAETGEWIAPHAAHGFPTGRMRAA